MTADKNYIKIDYTPSYGDEISFISAKKYINYRLSFDYIYKKIYISNYEKDLYNMWEKKDVDA